MPCSLILLVVVAVFILIACFYAVVHVVDRRLWSTGTRDLGERRFVRGTMNRILCFDRNLSCRDANDIEKLSEKSGQSEILLLDGGEPKAVSVAMVVVVVVVLATATALVANGGDYRTFLSVKMVVFYSHRAFLPSLQARG